jgi:hypothetical protein
MHVSIYLTRERLLNKLVRERVGGTLFEMDADEIVGRSVFRIRPEIPCISNVSPKLRIRRARRS